MNRHIRIQRAAAPVSRYTCNRCGAALVSPVEKTALYVWDGIDALLICAACVKPSDLYIWGDETYLVTEEV